MDEPFKEYQKGSKDKHSSMYIVVNEGDCEYGIAIGEKSEEKAKKEAFKNVKWRKESIYG